MRRILPLLMTVFFSTVTITPPFGYSAAPVRVRLGSTEVAVINRLQRIATTWNSTTPLQLDSVEWRVEPSVAESRTFVMGRRIMARARQLLDQMDVDSLSPTWIVVGRTQDFLWRSVRSLGCEPDLSATGNVFLMGITTCNRRVIVINLTGYFFIRSLSGTITPALEARPEPPIPATKYTIATRNLTALAHEWFHVARNKATGGFVPDNEPAWFREGMAEVVAGLAMVRAYPRRADYREFHVVRIRQFMDWSWRCRAPLSRYRNGAVPTMCEYTRGAAAIELLLARYGGLGRVMAMYQDARNTGDFWRSFRRLYGMSVASFELRADVYAREIRAAAS